MVDTIHPSIRAGALFPVMYNALKNNMRIGITQQVKSTSFCHCEPVTDVTGSQSVIPFSQQYLGERILTPVRILARNDVVIDTFCFVVNSPFKAGNIHVAKDNEAGGPQRILLFDFILDNMIIINIE